jgi:hypothetical protein
MSDIPADIRVISEDCVIHLPSLKPVERWLISNLVAKALMAERERCLSLARAEAEKRLENVGGYPASRVHDFLVVARSIERKIESGANAAADSSALSDATTSTRTLVGTNEGE